MSLMCGRCETFDRAVDHKHILPSLISTQINRVLTNLENSENLELPGNLGMWKSWGNVPRNVNIEEQLK